MFCTNVSFYRHSLNVILAPQVHSWYAADIPTNCNPVAHHTSLPNVCKNLTGFYSNVKCEEWSGQLIYKLITKLDAKITKSLSNSYS